ncbi:hypothetical protein SD77_2387 [Bacillus badius]|uniref:Uncharacterized protein n=1 Tax=Bacillus badius TaxID=1455 RepID=A0ABR5AYX5_BACBA|nr:hypothetical protein SD77_2387 [Bacillus badius]
MLFTNIFRFFLKSFAIFGKIQKRLEYFQPPPYFFIGAFIACPG